MKLLTPQSARFGLALLLADGLLFMTTDASKVPAPVVMLGFGLVVATLYLLVNGLLWLLGFYGLHVRRRHQLAGYLTALLGCVVALQSVGELGRRDVLVLVPLVLLGYVYSAYSQRRPGQGVER